jgi:hypothetical protein
MTVVIGVLAFAATLTGIAVTILLAIAALVEILPPLFAPDSEGVEHPAAGALQPPRKARPAARSGARLTR